MMEGLFRTDRAWCGRRKRRGKHKQVNDTAELHTLAKRLREMGKVQTAFVCGKRAVELKPDDWSAWYDLGEIAQCVGRRDEARALINDTSTPILKMRKSNIY